MMNKLSNKQEAFIDLMKESDEQARYGFTLINGKSNILDFYDDLSSKGFFDLSNIIKTGAYDYLKQVIIKARNDNHNEIIKKVIERLSVITKELSDPKIQEDENYWIAFARVFSELPPSMITNETIHLIAPWLKIVKRPLTDAEIGTKLIPSLLNSSSKEDHAKASLLLNYYTEVFWVPENFTKKEIAKFKMSDYCVSTALKKYASKFGEVCGKEACEVLVGKITDISKHEKDRESWIWIPAIEDHPQNVMRDESKSILVAALRDTLLSWFTSGAGDPQFIKKLISSDIEILRRIGIYVFNQKFTSLNQLFESVITPTLFHQNHLHEVYHFLKNRFSLFTPSQIKHIIDAIQNLPISEKSQDKEMSKWYLQRRFLHAIYQQNSKEIDEFYLDLNSKIGEPEPSHPDFYIYIESWRSSDDSPYNTKELISFLNNGELIEKLNNFKIADEMRSPNIRGLVRELEETIKIDPHKFILNKNTFLDAKSPYQYGYINGFYELWKSDKSSSNTIPAFWNEAWGNLFDLFEKLLFDQTFWDKNENDNGDLTPKKSWIPPLVADFIRSGLQNDDKSFSEDLLPRALILIKTLLKHLNSDTSWSEKSSMTTAINSSRGKTIETLVNYTLRTSRISEKKLGNHYAAWSEVESIFSDEIEKSRDNNFEFSTLIGSYIENINFLSKKWLTENFTSIFPTEYPKNLSCAIQGLAYTQGVSADTYHLLRNNQIFNFSIDNDIAKGEIKKHFIHRIAVAYLWGEEKIDSQLFNYLFDNKKTEELSIIARFFWSIQNQEFENSYTNLIINFWRKCIEWIKKQDEKPRELLLSLGMLSCYLDKLDEEKKGWLLMSVPFITAYNDDMHYIEELNYLADTSPAQILEVLEELLKHHIPNYDFGDYYKSLVTKLGENKDVNIRKKNLVLCNKLRNLHGFQELYENLK